MHNKDIVPGDSIRCWVSVEGHTSTQFHCYATGEDADTLLSIDLPATCDVQMECLGQIKIYETDFVGFDDERGIGYYTAFRVSNVELLQA